MKSQFKNSYLVPDRVLPQLIFCFFPIVCTIWNKGRELKPDHTNGATTIAGQDNTATNQLTTTAGGTLIQVQVRPSRSFGMDGQAEDHGSGIDSRRASSRGKHCRTRDKSSMFSSPEFKNLILLCSF